MDFSMPEADLLPSISSRRSQNDSNENHGANSSAVCRSLNLALSSSQHNPFQNKTGRYVPSRICLPPSSKLNGEAKKGKRQEDIHMLKLLHNKYLHWRFINAKAKEAVDSRTAAAEKSVYGLSVKIAEMKNDVVEKRIEVEILKRMQDLSLILESQVDFVSGNLSLSRDFPPWWSFHVNGSDSFGCDGLTEPMAVVVSEETPQGILGETLSKFSIWGIYITFVLAVGRFIRLQCSDLQMRIPFENLPSCDRNLKKDALDCCIGC